jgi:hypothetical protein
MNGAGEGKVEIFAPFGQAFDLTKRILFEPFDFAKWLTMGFAAFLAGLADGTHFNGGNFNPRDWNFRGRSVAHDYSAVHDQLMSWLTIGVIGFVLVIVCESVLQLLPALLFIFVGVHYYKVIIHGFSLPPKTPPDCEVEIKSADKMAAYLEACFEEADGDAPDGQPACVRRYTHNTVPWSTTSPTLK